MNYWFLGWKKQPTPRHTHAHQQPNKIFPITYYCFPVVVTEPHYWLSPVVWQREDTAPHGTSERSTSNLQRISTPPACVGLVAMLIKTGFQDFSRSRNSVKSAFKLSALGIIQEIRVAAIGSCRKMYFIILLLWLCGNDATLHLLITRLAAKSWLNLNSCSHSCVHLQLTRTKQNLGRCFNIDQKIAYFYIHLRLQSICIL